MLNEALARAPGSLYVSVMKPDGSLEQKCMYMSCEAFVRPTSQEFLYELVLSRCDDDGEGSGSNFFPPDVVFSIDKSTRLEHEGGNFGWFDRAGKRYNFDVEDNFSPDKLRQAISTALFQNIHSRFPGPEDNDELASLLTIPPMPTASDLLDAKGELLRISAELFKYDADRDRFQTMAPDVTVTLNSAVVKQDNSKTFLMIVYKSDSGDRILECEIGNALNAQFYTQSLSIVWVLNLDPDADPDALARGEGDPATQLCLSAKFEEAEEYVRFRNQYSVCLYEINHQASIDDMKMKDGDLSYVEDSIRDDVDPMDIEEDTDGESEAEDRRNISDSPDRRASISEVEDGLRNSQLAVSANNDRTFVIRGNKMGVFSTGDDGAVFKTTIALKDPKAGGFFNPSNILLHEKDTSMLLLDPNDETKLMRMDLERGEVVDTWSGGLTHNTPVKAVHRVNKYSNLTATQEFVALNKNQLMRMDPRTSEFVVQSKKYAAGTRAKLDCVATTGAGYLAVASENGDIRLYDQIGKNAKTHLPGLGDRIIGIDVTEDGNYILATTHKYLLVIDTRVQGQAKGGFQKSMGKNKPAPRRLTIKNEDVIKYRMGTINFTTAHFNTGSSLERSIVTSTGPFLVVWNFRGVKLGRTDNYKIRRYQDNVVADDFAYDNDGRIVVTLPNDVSVARR